MHITYREGLLQGVAAGTRMAWANGEHDPGTDGNGSTVKKEGKLRRHSNAIKGTLTDENKNRRVDWCLSMFDPMGLPEEPTFEEMYNVVHIPEKWFYSSQL